MNRQRLMLSTEICKEVGFGSALALHTYLKSVGMIEIVRNRWQLTRKYIGCDLARLKYVPQRGWRLMWTAEGVAFIKDMCNGQGRLVCKRVSA